MAEKEERYISITQIVAKENIETEKYRVMPRQDAIEKMAKALRSNIVETQAQCSCLNMAEAALNALLEK